MIRAALGVLVAAGIFSFLAFKDGGWLPGIILALIAVLPLGLVIASNARRRANGGQPAPWDGTAKKVITAVSVLLVAGLAYSLFWMFKMPKADNDLRFDSNLSRACSTPPKYFPQAAEHTGAGPHKVAVFYNRGDAVSLQQVRFPYDASEAWQTREAKDVQLVACFTHFDKGEKVGECRFDKGTSQLYTGRYKGSIVEARTHKKVGDIEVAGSPSADSDRDCPTLIYIKGKAEKQKFHTQPDPAAVQEALSKYVN
ncbi:hypothetical protein [Gordonia sp. (in: high G+C Gram-positive bacteria)]|uniref:hypothetical protein n=1 Tax=Gordonia sp. (in: high G+C Gram-positive bacteria) TaxID=84139 RepID=UPI0039E2ACF0